MNLLKIKKTLNSPYPFYENQKQALTISVFAGIFIAIFCYIFKPFELDEMSVIHQLGYGVIAFSVSFLFSIILPLIFKKQLTNKGWTIYKEFIWILSIMLCLGIVTYFYSAYILFNTFRISLPKFLLTIFNTTVTAVIPTASILLYKNLYTYKKIVKEVEKIDARVIEQTGEYPFYINKGRIRVYSENKKEFIDIYINEFLYLISSGNYIELYFEKDKTIQKKLIRNNISKAVEWFENIPDVMRCHRSYIVNLKKVKNISGNLQGYQFYFKNTSDIIPVSRSYTKKIKNYFLS